MKKTKDLLSKNGSRPKNIKFDKPSHIKDYPTGPGFTAGHLPQVNSGWRVFKPILNKDKCIGCQRCYLLCPDGTIFPTDDKKIDFDYDYCKGCGVCAYECPVNAIEMKKEER